MAIVTPTRARPSTPVGYEKYDRCVLSADVTAGQTLAYTGAMSGNQAVMAPSTTAAHGIALMDGKAGQGGFDVGIDGEMGGFTGLTPGAMLYGSAATAGALDNVATGNVAIPVRARTDTSIRFNFT